MILPRPRIPSEWLDLGFVRDVLVQQRVTFGTFLGAVLAATLGGSLLVTKQYEAMALIHLMPRAGKEVETNEVVSTEAAGYMEARERARTQIQIILSRAVRDEVVRQYQAQGYDDIEATPEALDALSRRVTAGPREDTQLVEIRVRHSDPERAAVLANLFAQVYRDGNLDARRVTARETQVWLEGRTEEYRAAVDATNKALLDFKLNNDVVDIEENIDSISSRLNSLQSAAGAANTERILLESTLAEHQRLLRHGETQVLTGMFDDPALQALAEERAQIVTQAAEVLARYGEQHPDHKKAVAHVKRIDDLLLEEVQRNVESEQARANMLRRQEERLAEELVGVKTELVEKQRLQQQYEELKLEHERARRFYEQLGERGSEVDLQAQTRLNDVRVVDLALPPARPISPNIPLNMVVGLGIGLVGGFGLALARHRGNETIDQAQDIEEFFGEPPLGAVPTFPFCRREADRLTYSFDHPRALLADAMRGIMDVMVGLLPKDRPARLLITSTGAAEGKTSVAAGLAIAYAQRGLPVLLVEAELQKPRLHDAFRLEVGPGLAEALASPAEAERSVRSSRIPNLSLMSGGAGPGPSNALLSSPEMKAVLERLSAVFPLVILDLPSSTLLGEGRALCGMSDGIVVVMRRGLVGRVESTRVLEGLRNTGGRLLGIVLNDVPSNLGEVPPPTSWGRPAGAAERAAST